MENEYTLLRIRSKASESSLLSERILREFIANYHDLSDEFNSWLYERRMIDPAIFLAGSLCDLEGAAFEDNIFSVSVFAGASGTIADDIIEENAFEDTTQVELLTNQTHRSIPNSKKMELFYAFDTGLNHLLPTGFARYNNEIISRYNKAQIDSRKLFCPSVTKEDVIDIRNRVGGYTLILLHGLLFPDRISSIKDVNEEYKQSPPLSKSQALYNFGAWTNRVDDLWDEEKDRKIGMKQLATEGCITWDNLPIETRYVSIGLSLYYPKDNVDKVFKEYFAPLLDKSIADKYNNRKFL